MSDPKQKETPQEEKFAISRRSFAYIGIGVLVIVIGFLLMMGGKSEDPNVFNPEIFSWTRIKLAPLVCLFGYLFMVVAILWRPRHETREDNTDKIAK